MNLVFFINCILLGIGLAMDAFSVSLANGLNEPQTRKKRMCLIADVFGSFQGIMPMITASKTAVLPVRRKRSFIA